MPEGMVKHIIFFKLARSYTPEIRKMHLRQMEDIFSPIGKKLPFIIDYRTGINFNEENYSWDFVIDSLFRNREDLKRYQESKEHLEAIGMGRHIEKSKAVIDYEF
jgi:hypothetical protein